MLSRMEVKNGGLGSTRLDSALRLNGQINLGIGNALLEAPIDPDRRESER
jgi:hypothetical protein